MQGPTGATLALMICVALALSACGEDQASSEKATGPQVVNATGGKKSGDATSRPKPKVTVPDGAPPKKLVAIDLIRGTGAEATFGRQLTVQYVGVKYKNGKEFEAYWRPGGTRERPVTFPLGKRIAPLGWDLGLQGMKVGGRRKLIVPPRLAYGPEGFPPAIGPNETLIYLIDLLRVR